MGRHAAPRDAGSTTGVATTILALLSAGTLASITLVGVHTLAPGLSERLGVSAPSVQPPAGVRVTPRSAATHSPGMPKVRQAKPPTLSDVAVSPVRGPSSTPQRRVTDVVITPVTSVVKVPPKVVPPPAVVPTRPPVATPSPSAQPPTTSRGHVHAPRAPESRHGGTHARDRAGADSGRTARSHRGSSGCAGHDARHHRAYPGNGHRDDRRRSGHGQHGYGDDRARSGHGQHGSGGEGGTHARGDNRGARGHGNDGGHSDSQHGHHGRPGS